MSLVDDLNNKKFDKRLIEWNLRNNKITKEEYDQLMNSLPDEQAKSTTVDLVSNYEEPSEMDSLGGGAEVSDSAAGGFSLQ